MNLKVNAKLDPKFQPLSIICRDMREATKDNGQDIVIGIERNKGYTYTYKTRIFADGTGHDEENFKFIERITKSLLWVAGGYKVIIAGSKVVGEKIYNNVNATQEEVDKETDNINENIKNIKKTTKAIYEIKAVNYMISNNHVGNEWDDEVYYNGKDQ